jgi:hypothetical protein
MTGQRRAFKKDLRRPVISMNNMMYINVILHISIVMITIGYLSSGANPFNRSQAATCRWIAVDPRDCENSA